MASNNVFIIYSKTDQIKVSSLINGISNVTPFPLDQSQTQIDESTKSIILKCSVFVCCLSINSSQLLFNVVKFARCVARKKINTYFIDSNEFLKKQEEQSFFKYKTRKINSISDLEMVNIFLEFIR